MCLRSMANERKKLKYTKNPSKLYIYISNELNTPKKIRVLCNKRRDYLQKTSMKDPMKEELFLSFFSSFPNFVREKEAQFDFRV